MEAQEHKDSCPFCRGLHWHKYKYLEDKLLEISRYVTIDERNAAAWGEEIADIIVLTGNAMDTFFKDMYDCPNFENESSDTTRKHNLPDYQRVYEKYYELSKNTVHTSFGLGKAQSLTPFKDFKTTEPEWWEAYNKTKHNFYTSMEKAKLGNALNLLAGLLILNALHICSKYNLGWDDSIESYKYIPLVDRVTLGALLRSKIGIGNWVSNYNINTKLFNFSYRVDESINMDSPFIVKF